MLLLEALHYVNYDLQKATRMFYRIHAQRQGLSVTFSQAECEKFDGLCEGSVIGKRKDFREAARRMNRSVETTLVQYYIWKARNRITYNALKNKRRRDPDECCHCKDGGLLIVCNSCCRAFHLDCLQPQLKKVPDGDWFCSLCTQHSPSRLRRSPQQKSGSIIATRLGFEGELPTENTPKGLLKPHLESKRQQLKAAHKEFSFLARKPPALKHVHVTPTIHSPSAKDPTLEVSPRSVKLYGNLHSDDDDDDEQKIKASPTEIADDLTNEEDDSDSDYKSDEDGADGGVVAETLSKRRQTKVGDSVESAPISIDVILPTCPEGFRIVLRNMNDGLIAVVEYARGPQGEKGYAEACSLIYPGDVITHVDGKPCEKNIHKTLALLRTPCDFGVKVIRITRSGAGPLPPFHLPQSSTIPETGPCFLTFFLPIVPEGFFLQLVETSATFGSICKFGGYKTRNGQTGFAELYNLFRVGDEIVAIDGFNCVGAKLTDVVTMFKKESISGWRAVMIRRWSPRYVLRSCFC